MSRETALTVFDQAKGLILSATGQLDFGPDAEIVNWSEVAEAIDPRGPQLKCADIVGQPFTIQRLKAFESSFGSEGEQVFWCVATTDSGMIFNTVLGGKVVVEEIRNIIWLNTQLVEARENGDMAEMQQWLAAGAGRKPRLVIEQVNSGKHGLYYRVQRTINAHNPTHDELKYGPDVIDQTLG